MTFLNKFRTEVPNKCVKKIFDVRAIACLSYVSISTDYLLLSFREETFSAFNWLRSLEPDCVSIAALLPRPEGKGNSRYRFKYLSIFFLFSYKLEVLYSFFPRALLEMFDKILDFYNLHIFVWHFHSHIFF